MGYDLMAQFDIAQNLIQDIRQNMQGTGKKGSIGTHLQVTYVKNWKSGRLSNWLKVAVLFSGQTEKWLGSFND